MGYIDSDCDSCNLFDNDLDEEQKPSSYINARLVSGNTPEVEDPCNKAWRIPNPKPLDPPYKPKEDLTDHRNLTYRDAPNQHSISAITDLQDILDEKLTDDDVTVTKTSEGTTIIVIGSKTFTIYDDGYIEENYYNIDEINSLLDEKQDVLTAGDGISIDVNSEGQTVISNTNASAEWGNITGDILDQTDLQNALDDKQNILTAGDGINIYEDSEGNSIIESTQSNIEWGNITGDITNQTDLVEYIDSAGGKIDSISVNGVEQDIDSSKNVDITVPTKTSDLTNDSNFVSDADYVHTDNNFTDELETKLEGIEEGAEVNVQADWDETDTTSDAYILNKPDLSIYAESSELSDVAFSGDYGDLLNTPDINDATLTIQKNSTDIGTFTANSSTNTVINIIVPVNTSDLTNDSGFIDNTVNDLENYYLKAETYTQEEVNNLISAITKITILVVEELPEGSEIEENVIYFVPSDSSEEDNVYLEYIYVNNAWELIGTTRVDLSNYYTKTETDALLDNKVDISTLDDYYTSDEVDSLLENYVESSELDNYYTKTEIDSTLEDYYTSDEVDNLLSGKQDTLVAGDNITITAGGESSSSSLPDGYTELESLTSTGTQYIITDISYSSSSSYKFIIDLNATDYITPGGCGWNAGGGIYFQNSTQSKTGSQYWSNGTSSSVLTDYLSTVRAEVEIEIDQSNSTSSYTYNFSTGDVVTQTRANGSLSSYARINFPLFRTTNNASPYLHSSIAPMTIYSFTAYVDDELVGQYIPAMRTSDSVLGMYDIIGDNFYTNDGTGTFVAGDIVSDYYTISAVDTTYSAGEGIEIDSANEISVDTSVVALQEDINDSTITLLQNGDILSKFSLNQSSGQSIDLGRSGDWFELIGVPFDSSDNIISAYYSASSDIEDVAYWKITSKDLIDISEESITFYSGEELQDIINNHNCYIKVGGAWLILGILLGEYDFAYITYSDVTGKTVPGPYSNVYAHFRGTNSDFIITLAENDYLEEAKGTITRRFTAGTGISISDNYIYSNREAIQEISVDTSIIATQEDLPTITFVDWTVTSEV